MFGTHVTEKVSN